jgi:hypothetical protein
MMMRKMLEDVICSEVGLEQKPDRSCLRAARKGSRFSASGF